MESAKSTLVAWIVDWIMSTRPHCQGTITANTTRRPVELGDDHASTFRRQPAQEAV